MTVTYAVLQSGRVVTRGPKETVDQFRERVEVLKHREMRNLK